MLELSDIRKTYSTGGLEVEALRSINLSFRNSEFVSILGPSGCGNTIIMLLTRGQ